MKNICDRLAEERRRLGLNKGEIAKIGNVANSTYGYYEDGSRSPDGEFFAAIAAAGADVLYILTGQRIGGAEAAAPMLNGKPLTREEACFLDNYRHCPPEGQAAIEATCAAFAKPKPGKKAG